MPTPTRAKPPVSAWIVRERKRLALKPRDLAERLSAAGLPVTEGTVRTWEAGRRPHPDNVEGLERIFGTRSPDYMAQAGEGDTSPGLADLIASLNDLVGELRAARQERADLLERVEALETAAKLRGTPGGGGVGVLPAPRVSAG